MAEQRVQRRLVAKVGPTSLEQPYDTKVEVRVGIATSKAFIDAVAWSGSGTRRCDK